MGLCRWVCGTGVGGVMLKGGSGPGFGGLIGSAVRRPWPF